METVGSVIRLDRPVDFRSYYQHADKNIGGEESVSEMPKPAGRSIKPNIDPNRLLRYVKRRLCLLQGARTLGWHRDARALVCRWLFGSEYRICRKGPQVRKHAMQESLPL